jgi:hypothetical protein
MHIVGYVIVAIIIILIFCDIILSPKREKLDVAVIVEPREHKHLVKVVNNILEKVPKETKVQIFHGKLNEKFVKDNFGKHIKSGKIILTNLGIENMDIREYSYLLTNPAFWHKIHGENILIFQTDSCICNSKINLNEYLKYDYVGGPSNPNGESYWQNGGFSFRKKSAMLRVINNGDFSTDRHPEDVFYVIHNKDKIKIPPHNVAKKFSVESQFYDKPYGVHKPWLWLGKDKLDKLKKNCPLISDIEQFRNV